LNKKSSHKINKLKASGLTEEELIRQQQELFAGAKERQQNQSAMDGTQ
jgi:hypothetical protein